MKKLIVVSAIGFLFLMPVISYAQPEQNEQKAPPVSPGPVREGDFAIKLVEVLRLGTVKNEAEAESMLASAGIAPKKRMDCELSFDARYYRRAAKSY
jgi:hypothetical protein